jgi:hypothetical protein
MMYFMNLNPELGTRNSEPETLKKKAFATDFAKALSF